MTNGTQNKPIVQSPRHPERQRTAMHAVDQHIKTNQDQLVVKQPQDLEHQQPLHSVDHQGNANANQDTGAVQSSPNSPSPSNTNVSPTFHAANSHVTQTTYNYTYMYGTGVVAGVGDNDHHESSPNANASRATSEGMSKSHNSGSSRNRQLNDSNAREDDWEESKYPDADTNDRAGSKGSKSHNPGQIRRKLTAEEGYEEDSQLDNYNTSRVSHNSRPASNLRLNAPQGPHSSGYPHNRQHTSEDNYEDGLQPDNHIAGRVPHTSAPNLNLRLGTSRSGSNSARPGTPNHDPVHPHKWRWQSVNENDFEESEDLQSGHLGSNVGMFPNPGLLPNLQPHHSNTGFAVSTGLFNFGLQI